MAAPLSFNIETVKQKFNELIEFVKLLAQKQTDVIDVPNNEILQNFSSQATRETADSVARRELVAKLISSGIGLAASIALTYFAVNYMTNAMDPTRKEKQKSRERVWYFIHVNE
jgi:hypothetical protein